jgi:hypothetical protein
MFGGLQCIILIRIDNFIPSQGLNQSRPSGVGFLLYVRPAGRVHLEVQVLYRPDRGNC